MQPATSALGGEPHTHALHPEFGVENIPRFKGPQLRRLWGFSFILMFLFQIDQGEWRIWTGVSRLTGAQKLRF